MPDWGRNFIFCGIADGNNVYVSVLDSDDGGMGEEQMGTESMLMLER